MKRKNLAERKRNRRKNKKTLRTIKILLLIFVTFLVVLLLIDFGVINSVKKIFTKKKPIVIEGQCYSFMNTILYQINSEDDCKKECSDRCWVQKEDYDSSKFIYTPGACNLCNCYCS